MDTTSNALSRTLQLLCENQDVQDKIRAELLEAAGGETEDIPYDQLVSLPYMDAVCRETLRLCVPTLFRLDLPLMLQYRHPPVTFLFRE